MSHASEMNKACDKTYFLYTTMTVNIAYTTAFALALSDKKERRIFSISFRGMWS